MHRLAVINVVGLSRSLIGTHTPNLQRLAASGFVRTLEPMLPAVTTTSQSCMLTGGPVSDHGIVANGWFDRSHNEVQFWKQSNALVEGPKVWDAARARDSSFTCANMFWWYNMYSSADVSVTPRPIYCADGRKIPDCYSHPAELRHELQTALGRFPLFQFWGPAAGIESTRWIAEASVMVAEKYAPTLELIYLPHLDYALQKYGPDHDAIPRALAEIDEVVGRLLDFFTRNGVRTLWLSEYGIESVDRVIAPNRTLRELGMLAVRTELGRELLDAGASRAFAVADHQVAHVYVRHDDDIEVVRDAIAAIDGVESVLDADDQAEHGIDHTRSGELIAVAESGAWFTYDYWNDDNRAPDFARTVDIHRKPGYDPRELFVDPAIRLPKLAIAQRLLRKKLGQRTLMDVIPLDATLVRGSHGRTTMPRPQRPILIADERLAADVEAAADAVADDTAIPMTSVFDLILAGVFGSL